ncbi:unnamed protein product [Ilex paraguariensis]|uniref:Uncharacterized protein n=1 Tax=Ilex paraguariensis TaxID=185542 RepID=A0ABC8RRL8_9AQUA
MCVTKINKRLYYPSISFTQKSSSPFSGIHLPTPSPSQLSLIASQKPISPPYLIYYTQMHTGVYQSAWKNSLSLSLYIYMSPQRHHVYSTRNTPTTLVTNAHTTPPGHPCLPITYNETHHHLPPFSPQPTNQKLMNSFITITHFCHKTNLKYKTPPKYRDVLR